MLSPGTEIERYRIEAELGRGACAVVYRVHHTRLHSQHALKLLLWRSEALRQRLVQEGRLQAGIQHPNVVPVTDVVDVDQQIGLIAQFIDGPNFASWLQIHTPSPTETEDIFRQIVSGLAAAHARGVVHRDLKPANILMQEIDGRWIPRITDFGIAKILNDTPTGLTRTGAAVGTPGYMAPEQFRDAASADTRADIFALGCILYEMVTGHLPFTGPSMAAIELLTLAGEYVDPTTLRSNLPGPIIDVIAGCLYTDPRQRIPDCKTILAILDGGSWTPPTLDELPPRADTMVPPPGNTLPNTILPIPTVTPPEYAPPSHRLRNLAALLSGVTLLGILGLTLPGLLSNPDPDPEPEPTPELLSITPEPAAEPAAEPAPEPEAEPAAEPAPEPTPDRIPPPDRTPPPTPEPAAEPEPEVVAAPPVRGDAVVSVSGNVDEVWLERSGRRYEIGRVPSGTYSVHARMAEGIIQANNLSLSDGQDVVIRCSTAFKNCRW